jgi:hypothetical protein
MRGLISVAIVVATGCGGAEISVRNHSSMPLQDVIIAAAGSSTTIELIAPESDERTSLCPRGEAGSADFSFRANGQQYRHQLAVYFECDFLYRLQIDVSPRLEVTAAASLR